MRTTDNTMLGFEGHSRFNFELIFFLLALGFNLFVVIVWLRNPLVDYYSFRQAQTAMSAYWMKQDGQWFNLLKYETPEFGAPWRIPYEFPIYQWIVAVLYQITHISLDTLGRATSAVFFYGCFPLLYMIIRGLRMDRRLFFLAAGMLLLSPIYMYWSRTFMMESTVLFFCFFYVAALQKYLSTDRPVLWWILMTLAGIAALLVKVTTFPAFAFAAFALVLSDMATSQNFKSRARWLRTYLPIGLGMVLMLAIIKLWLNYSDMVKESNDFTRHLTSAALDTWNWGTLQQRFSSALWITTIFNRTIPQAIGSTGALVIVLIAFFLARPKSRKMILFLLFLFLSDLLLFTNLHIVHDYYQYSVSLFLVFALALSIFEMRRISLSAYYAACAVVVAMEIWSFCTVQGPSLYFVGAEDSQVQSGYFVNRATPRDSVILVAGFDWNPLVAYYSQRRSIYFPGWADVKDLQDVMDHTSQFTGGRPLSAIIENLQPSYAWEVNGLTHAYIAKMATISRVVQFGNCRVLLLPQIAQTPIGLSVPKHLVINRTLDEQMRSFVKDAKRLADGG